MSNIKRWAGVRRPVFVNKKNTKRVYGINQVYSVSNNLIINKRLCLRPVSYPKSYPPARYTSTRWRMK
jgi:hypothetical protein